MALQPYFDIAFTPSVLELQKEKGSRAMNAANHERTVTNPQLGHAEIAHISARDSLYMATASETGLGITSGFDVFIDRFAPEMLFELDVFWVKAGGVEPVDLIGKLKGRVSQLHLKDLKKGTSLPQFGGLPKDAFKELGNGMIPMEPIIVAAKDAGVAHCHVEQDQSPDPLASVRESMAYLKGL